MLRRRTSCWRQQGRGHICYRAPTSGCGLRLSISQCDATICTDVLSMLLSAACSCNAICSGGAIPQQFWKQAAMLVLRCTSLTEAHVLRRRRCQSWRTCPEAHSRRCRRGWRRSRIARPPSQRRRCWTQDLWCRQHRRGVDVWVHMCRRLLYFPQRKQPGIKEASCGPFALFPLCAPDLALCVV